VVAAEKCCGQGVFGGSTESPHNRQYVRVPEAPPTNIRVLKPSRMAFRAGDVFAIGLPDGSHVLGKIIEADAEVGPLGPGSNLIYLYWQRARTPSPDLDGLRASELMIPPLFINRLPSPCGALAHVLAASSDLRATGRIAELVVEQSEGPLTGTVELAEDSAA
jgi:Immunity protein 26